MVSTPRRASSALRAGQPGDALQHRVGALRAFDRQHPPIGHRYRLAGIERAERRSDGKAQHGVGVALAGQGDGADLPGIGQQIGRHLMGAAHGKAFGLEEAHDAAQDRVVPAGEQAEDLRQAREEARVRPYRPHVRPPHAAGDDQLVAPLGAQRRHDAADLAQIHPGMRKAGDARVGRTDDARNVHVAAARNYALRDHQRQPTAAREDAEPSHGDNRCCACESNLEEELKSARGTQSARSDCALMKSRISRT